MNPLISSGDAKITSARSPIMPAGTRAGASLRGPSSLTLVLKRRLRSHHAAAWCRLALRSFGHAAGLARILEKRQLTISRVQ
jgi:hypothetical protein